MFSDDLLFYRPPTNNSVDTRNSQCIHYTNVRRNTAYRLHPPECPLMICNVGLITQDDKWFLQDFKRRSKPERFVLREIQSANGARGLLCLS